MQCTGGTRSTVRIAARAAALVAVAAALVTGGVVAGGVDGAAPAVPAPATAGSADPVTIVVALPRIGASNRAW
jgi:hypothetical protein